MVFMKVFIAVFICVLLHTLYKYCTALPTNVEPRNCTYYSVCQIDNDMYMEVEQEVINRCPIEVNLPQKSCFVDEGVIIPPHVGSVRLTSKSKSHLSKETAIPEMMKADICPKLESFQERPGTLTLLQLKQGSKEIALEWNSSSIGCFENVVFSYIITWKSSADYDYIKAITNITVFTIEGLQPQTCYDISIQIVTPNNFSSLPLQRQVATSATTTLEVLNSPVCEGDHPILVCSYNRIMSDCNATGTTASLLNNQEAIIKEDGQVIEDLRNNSDYRIRLSSTGTTLIMFITVLKTLSVGSNTVYSCSVTLADGAMQESRPVNVEVMDCKNEPFSGFIGALIGNGILGTTVVLLIIILMIMSTCLYRKRNNSQGSGVHQDIEKDGHEEPTNEDEDEDRGSVMVEQENPSYIPLEVKIPSDDLKKEYVNA